MRALKNIDVAFVCMNLPYTMPPDEAADAVKAFHPKIVIPYHYRRLRPHRVRKRAEGNWHRGSPAGLVSENLLAHLVLVPKADTGLQKLPVDGRDTDFLLSRKPMIQMTFYTCNWPSNCTYQF